MYMSVHLRSFRRPQGRLEISHCRPILVGIVVLIVMKAMVVVMIAYKLVRGERELNEESGGEM